MTEKITKKWNDERVATLLEIVGDENPVSVSAVERAAQTLEFTVRSIASKLRQLDRDVASLAKEKVSKFSIEETDALSKFVNSNPNTYTYKEIAEQFAEGKFSAKEVQGKLLALELTALVKPAEKVVAARTYTPEEETKFVELVKSGTFIEDIASALNKRIESVRGKALSLLRNGTITKIPAQRESHANASVDPVDQLGDKISTMTVAEIATAVDKTERGIRTMLTRRGIKVADYDGAKKREKAEGKRAA